jgi:hypothetical protein
MRRLLLALLVALTVAPAASAASPLLGIKGDAARFQTLTNQDSQVRHVIVAWGQGVTWGSHFTDLIPTLGPIPMVGLNTRGRNGKEAITPQQIALGKGDGYLAALNAAVNAWGKPIYIRPFGEMNGYWNLYCAYTKDGRVKPGHQTSWFRKAFARVYLIVHGGSAATINAKLRALGLPPISGDLPMNPMPATRVIWNPQGYGSPDLPGNSAQAYYPGDAYVDVVGNDLYDIRKKAEWPANEALYKAHPGKPYSFPEWGLWGIDDPKFICTMSEFLQTHKRTEMAAYFESVPGSIFDLATKPGSKLAYRNGISPLGLGQKAACGKAPPKPVPAAYRCTGSKLKLFDNSNIGGVLNGGTPPSFSTKGKAYCLVQLVTYHWNGAQGATPGTIGLGGATGVLGPWKARGSAGQGGAPNVNWTATVPTARPTVINGTYTCRDSDPATWSQNPATGGHGFCIVYVLSAVKTGGGPAPAPAPPPAPKPAPKPGGSTLLSVVPSPASGKAPLKVDFALGTTITNAASWAIDFGDGQRTGSAGKPPTSVAHTYAKDGNYKVTFSVKVGAYAAYSTFAQVTVGAGTPPVLNLTASPTSGTHPLTVTFTITNSIPGVASWVLKFGDGTQQGGSGAPPASVTHTYTKQGTYGAFLVLAQQQTYGGVQYIVPRGGLAVVVG